VIGAFSASNWTMKSPKSVEILTFWANAEVQAMINENRKMILFI
jgi:hypothetical protein